MSETYVDSSGATVNKECPIFRIRKISDNYKGLLLVSINGEEYRITAEQWKMLDKFMRGW
jgi:uncharacterized Fe-S cluster-containing protein